MALAEDPKPRAFAVGDVWATDDGRLFFLREYRGKSEQPWLAEEVEPRLPYDAKVPPHRAWFSSSGHWALNGSTDIDLKRFVAHLVVKRRRLA